MRPIVPARHLVIAVAVIAATMTGTQGLAGAQAAAAAEPGAKQARSVQGRTGAERQNRTAPIICTKRGCQPLPPHCHAETEFTWAGDPTGYQLIICP